MKNSSGNSNGKWTENMKSGFWYLKNKLVILGKSLKTSSPISSEN